MTDGEKYRLLRAAVREVVKAHSKADEGIGRAARLETTIEVLKMVLEDTEEVK